MLVKIWIKKFFGGIRRIAIGFLLESFSTDLYSKLMLEINSGFDQQREGYWEGVHLWLNYMLKEETEINRDFCIPDFDFSF